MDWLTDAELEHDLDWLTDTDTDLELEMDWLTHTVPTGAAMFKPRSVRRKICIFSANNFETVYFLICLIV
jgi:hypothetical protein